jgi:RNA polymerase sigma-70 factor (family 1)
LTEWARALRASDQQAFTAIYEVLHSSLLRYSWRLTGDEEAGYDILQEAFLRLWKMRRRIDPEQSVEALLYRIVRNLAYKHNRRRKRQVSTNETIQDPPVPAQAAEVMDANTLQNYVARWVGAMPERRREVFELSRNSGLTHQEIADLLDISPKTVNNHIVAALRDLRDRLRAFDLNQTLL